jgi:hypothetical protein
MSAQHNLVRTESWLHRLVQRHQGWLTFAGAFIAFIIGSSIRAMARPLFLTDKLQRLRDTRVDGFEVVHVTCFAS